MSGYKHATVTISQEEYRRLHDADMKKKFREFVNLNEQNSSQDVQYQILLQQLELRERQLEEALASVSQTSNQIDDAAFQDLVDQNAMCFDSLAAALQDSNIAFNSSLASLSEDFAATLQQERERYRSHIQALVANQEAFYDRESAKMDAAQQWINRCLVLADFIQSQYDHERFIPGSLSRILRNLNFAETNLADGFPESSIQGSQQAYLELSDLHFELEQITIQWKSAFESTYSAIRELIAQLESNSAVYALGLQGEQLPNDVDLDYWTHGRYDQLLDHCRQLAGYLLQDQSCLTLEDINRIYEQILPVIRESFETIVYDARLNALNSQLRMNIAEQALQALEVHGFRLEDAGYSGNDMRSQFDAHLDSPDGSKVVIHVVPAEKADEELSNELEVITTHPYLKTEHEARLRWDELSQSLSQFNLRVTRPKISSAPPDSASHASGLQQSDEKEYIRSER